MKQGSFFYFTGGGEGKYRKAVLKEAQSSKKGSSSNKIYHTEILHRMLGRKRAGNHSALSHWQQSFDAICLQSLSLCGTRLSHSHFSTSDITAGSILRKGAAKKADLSICGYRNIKVAHNVKTCLNGSFLERLSLKKNALLFLSFSSSMKILPIVF